MVNTPRVLLPIASASLDAGLEALPDNGIGLARQNSIDEFNGDLSAWTNFGITGTRNTTKIPGCAYFYNNAGSAEQWYDGIGICQQVTGDFDIVTKIVSTSVIGATSEGHVLFVAHGLSPTSAQVIVMGAQVPANLMTFARTDFSWYSTAAVAVGNNLANIWYRLRRVGNVFSGFSSVDGVNWTQLGTGQTDASVPSTCYIGIKSGDYNGGTAKSFGAFDYVRNNTTAFLTDKIATLVSQSFAGTLDPSTALASVKDLSLSPNANALAESSDRFLVDYSIDGGAFTGSYITWAAFKALSPITVASSFQLKCKFVSDGVQQIQATVFSVGTLTVAATPTCAAPTPGTITDLYAGRGTVAFTGGESGGSVIMRATSGGAIVGGGTVASGSVTFRIAVGANTSAYELVCVKAGYNDSTAAACGSQVMAAGLANSDVLTTAANGNVATGETGTFNESLRNVDPTEALVVSGTAYKILNVGKTGTYAPAAPGAAVISSHVDANGSVTLTIVAAAPTDVIYARYALKSATSWSAESETFKRTGSGALAITGLVNDSEYYFTVYAKSGSIMSAWAYPLVSIPTDGTSTDIKTVLYNYLSTNAGVVAAVSTRLYPDAAPNSAAEPYITMQLISEPSTHHLTGAASVARSHWQLDCWASTSETRTTAAEALRNALDGLQRIQWGGLWIKSARIINRVDTIEDNQDATDATASTYRTRIDAEVVYTRSVPTF